MLALLVSLCLVNPPAAAAGLPTTFADLLPASAQSAANLAAPVTTITGTVMDLSGGALPRATVRLIDSDGSELGRTLTDAGGVFQFDEAALHDLPARGVVDRVRAGDHRRGAEHARHHLVAGGGGARKRARLRDPDRSATSQIGTTTTVITAEDLANRSNLSVGDVLRSVPAVTVVRTGGLGNLTSVFIRGGESNYTKVLLDGIPLNDPGGFFNFGSLTTDHLERIEIVRGPQSALFGSDAMAGVIQLFSASADRLTKPFSVIGSLEAGNFSTWHGGAGVAGHAGTFTYHLEGARLETDNEEPNNAFRHSSVAVNVGGSINERTSVRLIARGSSGRVGTPGQAAFGRPDLDAFGDRRDTLVGASARMRASSRWEQQLFYTFANSRQISSNLVADPPYTPAFDGRTSPFEFFDFLFDSKDDFDRHHLGYQSDWRLGSIARRSGEHIVTAAFEWEHEGGTLDDRLTPDAPSWSVATTSGGPPSTRCCGLACS